MHKELFGIFTGSKMIFWAKKRALVCVWKNLWSFDHYPHQECLYSSIFQCHEHELIKCRYPTKLSWVRDYCIYCIGKFICVFERQAAECDGARGPGLEGDARPGRCL